MLRQACPRRLEGNRRAKSERPLPLGELEPAASAFLTVLLTLVGARIAGQITELFELAAQLGVELNQRAGNAEPDGACLAAAAAALSQDKHVEFVGGFRRQKRLPDERPGRGRSEILFRIPAIDGDLTFAGPEKNAGDGAFSAPSPLVLNNLACQAMTSL